MSAILGVLVLAMPPLALAALIAPPIVIATRRRRVAPAVLLYLAAVAALGAWLVAWNADLDHADATGAAGHAFAGGGWFLVAAALAAAAIAVTRAPGRRATVRG